VLAAEAEEEMEEALVAAVAEGVHSLLPQKLFPAALLIIFLLVPVVPALRLGLAEMELHPLSPRQPLSLTAEVAEVRECRVAIV
jgi:hypothetical protein